LGLKALECEARSTDKVGFIKCFSNLWCSVPSSERVECRESNNTPTNLLDDLGDILAAQKIHVTILPDVSHRCRIYSCDLVHISAISTLNAPNQAKLLRRNPHSLPKTLSKMTRIGKATLSRNINDLLL
jgi:hypothetical protein